MHLLRMSAVVPLCCLACAPEFDIVDGAHIVCTSNDECPESYLCDLREQRCYRVGVDRQAPPVIRQIGVTPTVFRPREQLSLRLTVSDANAPVAGTVPVSLQIEFAVGPPAADGTREWQVATAQPPSPFLVDAEGTLIDVVWSAIDDARAAHGGLTSIRIDTNGDGQADSNDEEVVSYVSEVVLRVVATDDVGLTTTSEVTPAVPLGNLAPVAELLPLPPQDAAPSGSIALELRLDDPALDLINVDIEFSTASDPTWRRAAILQGSTEHLIPDPSLLYVAVWDSRALPNTNATIPQGIGNAVEDVSLRIRGFETVADDGTEVVEHFGPWSSTVPLPTLVNQQPPRVEGIYVPRADAHAGSSMVPISYWLSDAEQDPVDVRFEYSFDLGLTWERCREATVPWSEGTSGLSTVTSTSFAGAVEHLFFWDPGGVRLEAQTNTRLRVRSSDGNNPEEVFVTTLATPVAATGATPVDTTTSLVLAGQNLTDVEVTDFNQDGLADFGMVSLHNAVYLYRATGTGFAWSQILTQGTVPCGERNLRFARLNDDAYPDLVYSCFSTVVADNRLFVSLNDGSGTFPAPTGYATGQHGASELDVADLNGDGALDIVLLARGDAFDQVPPAAVSVFYGQTASSLPTGVFDAAITYTVGVDANSALLTLGDVTGDGAADLLLGSGGVSGESIQIHHNQAAAQPATPFAFEREFVVGGPLQAIRTSRSGQVMVAGRKTVWLVEGDSERSVTDGFLALTGLNLLLEDAFLADMNNDGVEDLLFVEHGGIGKPDVIRMARGVSVDGTLHFDSPELLHLGQGTNRADEVVPADINHDGILDLLIPTGDTTLEQVQLDALPIPSTDYGTFAWGEAAGDEVEGYPQKVIPADLNYDGVLDLIFAIDSAVQVFEGVATSRLPRGELAFRQSFDFYYRGVELLPALDGTVEIWVAAGDGLHRLAPVSDSPLSYALTETLFSDESVDAVAVGDLDRDGLNDIVAVASDQLQIGLGNASGGFDFTASLAAAGARATSIDDYDRDGVLDLVVAVLNDTWILGGASATSFTQRDTLAAVGPYGAVLTDFDADGVLDAWLGGWIFNYALGNNGRGGPDGTFDAPAPTGTDGTFPGGMLLADFNLDGIADTLLTGSGMQIAVGSQSGGQASPTFATPVDVVEIADINRNTNAAGIADFDFDGVVDIVDAREYGGFGMDPELLLWLGRADGPGIAMTQTWLPFDSQRPPLDRTALSARVQLWGTDTNPGGVTALDEPLIPADILVTRFAVEPGGTVTDYPRELRATGLLAAAVAIPLGGPWTITDDLVVRRVLVGTSGQQRLRVEHRFGARTDPESRTDLDRAGLDLSSADLAEQRGLLVEIPVVARQRDNLVPGKVLVFQRLNDWARASDSSDDPISALDATQASAAELDTSRYLPCVAEDGSCVGDRIVPRPSWQQLTEVTGDFTSGTGARFIVDANTGVLRLLLDRGGTILAYRVP